MLLSIPSRRQVRIAIVAVALFLVFDFTALALNFWLSWKIEKDAVAINLAGRQRMLSQRMVKSLLQIEVARLHDQDTTASMGELRLTFELFDNTLQGFARGHTTRSGGNEPLFLGPVRGEAAQQLIAKAEDLWSPYRGLISDVIRADDGTMDAKIASAVIYAKAHNLQLLDLMNDLTTELESQTQRESRQIRLYQGSAFLLAMLNFIGAVYISMRRTRVIAKSHGLLDSIVNKISACVIVVGKSDVILKANHTAEQLLGYGSDELVGHRIGELLQLRDGRLVARRKDGSTFPASQERDEIIMDGLVLRIDTIIDITRQRQTEEHLTTLAYHDLLTGLPNRLLFDDRLQLELARARRNEHALGILFIDLDNFKPINDTYGHGIGDLLLQDVAARLKRCLREGDTISRHGGDEFTVIVSEVGNRINCERIAQVILDQLGKPFAIGTYTLVIGASIGISLFPDDGDDGPLLVAHADQAMYWAKRSGRCTYCFYSGGKEQVRRT